ncbi:helix-turn-helix transcriptional regulator [Methylorubrum thiocyanatum]|uniref:helix-turn-helix transcriptional regulator n=1 Tax=Methylorubrum thiocyanatum TaxID=47958 RepID=UPI003F808650
MPAADKRFSALPPGMIPLGLSRLVASTYVGVSPSTWDSMVDVGQMPKPKRIGRRRLWDRREVEEAFARLDAVGRDSGTPPGAQLDDDWDDVAT